ncbi:hypothetical protein Vadar_034405 [Vaccinium darrowii]|uniref:Uncharacterized protein n=1 Tax=Vaccinium darrowii TaxID=229202 RepID=A0ACB7XVE6_9ERIC|nr:hypothetical protein Vadar_034405 [Vaccinium darrowii]
MPTPLRKARGDLRPVITQKRVERNRAKSDMTGGNHALDRLVLSPFSPEIESLDPLKGFSLPKFSTNDAIMCKVFPSSLGEASLLWFDKLEAESKTSWKQLSTTFTARFVTHSKVPKEVEALLALKKGKKEPLRDFTGRYFDTYNEIEGCNEELAVTSFKLALPLGNRLRNSFTKRAATSIKELMDRVEKHARIERTTINQREKSNPREAINTLFKEPIYKILEKIRDEPYFTWPPKMPGDPANRNSKWRRSYHEDYDHMTANCRALKQHLEELVTAGHLRDFIDDGAPATAAQPEQRR